MSVLAVLQNQWFKNPDHVRNILGRRPEARERLIRYALFAGCRTGRVLRQIFGELCDDFRWEEASPHIGGHASSVFPADLDHLRAAYTRVAPSLVLAFGRIAGDAMRQIVPPERLIVGPHPTARGADTMPRLLTMRALFGAARAERRDEGQAGVSGHDDYEREG